MVFQIFVTGCGTTRNVCVPESCDVSTLQGLVASEIGIPHDHFYLTNGTKCINSNSPGTLVASQNVHDASTIDVKIRIIGGIDFQHREGSKIGSGGQLSESQAAMERKERLRKLALETIDITKDPYIMKNHLGTFECKLCLTLHNNEGNYLAHTQGKRHQVGGWTGQLRKSWHCSTLIQYNPFYKDFIFSFWFESGDHYITSYHVTSHHITSHHIT